MAINKHIGVGLATVLAASQLPAGVASAQTAEPPTAGREEFEDIVVTARRVDESAQNVPVAMSVFSGDQLLQRGVTDLPGIGTITPGLSLSQGTGSTTQLNVAIRGNSEVDTQLALDPAVGIYVDDVYIARSITLGVNIYDLQRVEILKGPQGTLFGRNTTGGALNITTADPANRFEGYINGSYGNYDRINLQGAVSLPIGDEFGIRIAGNLTRRDGYTRNVLLGQRLEGEHSESIRVKLLWTPGNWVIRLNGDYTNVDQTPVASVATPIGACDPFEGFGVHAVFNPNCGTPASIAFITGLYGPGGLIAAAAGFPGGLLVDDGNGNQVLPPSLTNIAGAFEGFIPGTIAAVLAQNAAAQNNPRRVSLDTNGVTQLEEFGGSLSISHDFGSVTARSITAYRELTSFNYWDADGTSLPLLDVRKPLDQDQVSQEFQVVGQALNNALSYAVGYYYFHETGTDIVDQDIGGTQSVTTLITDVVNSSHALYAQGSYDLPFLPGLKATLGYRQSWDSREVTVRHQALGAMGGGIPNCGLDTALIAAFGTAGTCAATVSRNFNGHSLLAGLDYRISPELLLYASYKEGFRSGGFSGRAGTLSQLLPVPPETLGDIEVGLKSDWFIGTAPVRLNVALFRSRIENRQREFTRQTPTGGLTTIVESAQRGTVRGLEIEGAIRPVRHLSLNFSLSYIDAENTLFIDRLGVDRSGEPVPQTPKWHFTAGFVYSRPISAGGNLNLSVDYSWLGSQSFGFNPDPSVTADGYGIVNARAGWENILGSGVSLHAYARNLTDTSYVVGAVFLRSNFGYSINYYGAPRTYGLELGFRF